MDFKQLINNVDNIYNIFIQDSQCSDKNELASQKQQLVDNLNLFYNEYCFNLNKLLAIRDVVITEIDNPLSKQIIRILDGDII